MGVSQGMSASSKPRLMWVRCLWAGCVHTPGESRLGKMGKIQAAPAAQDDPMPSGGVLLCPEWVPEHTHVYSGSRSSSRQKQQPCWSGPAQYTPRRAGWRSLSFQSFPLDVANEGNTSFTSLREGSDHHPSTHEAQCRLQVSVPMEGSAQLGMKRK